MRGYSDYTCPASTMNDNDTLFSMPAIAVVLEKVASRPEGVGEHELHAPGLSEEESARALEVLSAHGLLEKTDAFIRIARYDENIGKVRKIIGAFRQLNDIAAATLFLRGILTATTYYRCLVHRETLVSMMAEEGIEPESVLKAISADEERGYFERLEITYRTRGQVKEKFFPFIPYHHYDDFAGMTGRVVEAVGDGLALPGDEISLSREVYLLGNYPEALAEQARRYVSEKNDNLLQRIRNEAFDIIWCYDRY